VNKYKWTVNYSEEDSLYYIYKMVYMCAPDFYETTYEYEGDADAKCDELNEARGE